MQPVSPPPGKFALAWDGTGTVQSIAGCEVHYRLARGPKDYLKICGIAYWETKPTDIGERVWRLSSEDVYYIWNKKTTRQLDWIVGVCLSLQLRRATKQMAFGVCISIGLYRWCIHCRASELQQSPGFPVCSHSTATSLLTQTAERVSHKDLSAPFDVGWRGFRWGAWLSQTFNRATTVDPITRQQVQLDFPLFIY